MEIGLCPPRETDAVGEDIPSGASPATRRSWTASRPASLLAAVLLAFVVPAGALELRVAAWNLEHLDDANGAGCVGRVDGDYTALAERIDALGADVIAFQEVENAAAAARVFDDERWSVEVSSRPSTGYGRSCRGRSPRRIWRPASRCASPLECAPSISRSTCYPACAAVLIWRLHRPVRRLEKPSVTRQTRAGRSA